VSRMSAAGELIWGESLAKSGRELFASDAAREAVAASLGKMLLDDGTNRPVSEAKTLPVSRLSPEVLKRFGMSKSSLYRGDHTKFYSVIPLGMQNGRAYQSWQFVGDVPSLLPKALEILSRKSRLQVNTFFVSEQDALNELSPAEVLAGLPFEDRAALAPEQSRITILRVHARIHRTSLIFDVSDEVALNALRSLPCVPGPDIHAGKCHSL
jgi:hypothetical protein